MTGRWVKLGVVLVVLGVAGFFGIRQLSAGDAALPAFNTVEVDRGEVSQRVVAHGSLQPVQKVTVGSQVSGIIDEIHVDFNSPVRRGQVLARIDPSTFEAEARSAEAELESAEAALELARMQWERVQELRAAQFVAPSEVDQARVTMRQADAQLSVRRHALERAQRELDRATILAPTDGMVISREVDVGQTVAASLNAPILFELATDLSRMHIHASVSEADIGQVEEGHAVRFVVDAYRDREFTGEVVQVRNAPITEDNVVHYETIIAVENPELLLKPGMTAEVSIITAEVEEAVRVRNTALRARLPDDLRPPDAPAAEDGDGQVYLLRNGELQAVRVRAGLSDGVNTEILDGVEPGDVLVLGLTIGTGNEGERRSLFGGNRATF